MTKPHQWMSARPTPGPKTGGASARRAQANRQRCDHQKKRPVLRPAEHPLGERTRAVSGATIKKRPAFWGAGRKLRRYAHGCLEGITGIRGKRGPACERGGRACRTKPSSTPNLCSKDTVFKNFYWNGDLQIIQRDSCFFVILVLSLSPAAIALSCIAARPFGAEFQPGNRRKPDSKNHPTRSARPSSRREPPGRAGARQLPRR